MDAKKTALKDIDNYLEKIHGNDFREYAVYSKDLDTKENEYLNTFIMNFVC